MQLSRLLNTRRRPLVASVVLITLLTATAVMAAVGDTHLTPSTPMELPVEVEIELSPAGSLKQAALWKELFQLMQDPYSPIERRPSFNPGPDGVLGTADDVPLPDLNTYDLGYNFLTGQPLRLRTSDGEVSWDQPGPLFDPAESCLDPGTINCDIYNTPSETRTVIGHLVACPDTPPYEAAAIPADFCDDAVADFPNGSSLVVYNPNSNADIPPHGTVVAVAAYFDGMLHEFDPETGELEEITELEAPVNEEDFFRDPLDTTGIPVALQPYIGRLGAETLGKALFWDMQVGSDGVQACGSCHFNAGADNRTRNQLNPGTNAGDTALDVASVAGSPTTNVEVLASDFPFHMLADPETVGEETNCGTATQAPCASAEVVSDANDVMSSMGISQFKEFVDIPAIGTFLPAANGIAALPPDIGNIVADPIPSMQGVRRVEPRNTPTFHGAGFNFDNFWDGRARFNFNGGSVFGPSDPQAHIFINPGLATSGGGEFAGATMGHLRPELLDPTSEDFDPEVAEQPVRIKFSSLASQAVGPPLSEFEMSFLGRNWPKLGKKLLQGDTGNIQNQGNGAPQQPGTNRANAVVPLANQLVAVDDSRLGPFSNQGGVACTALGRPTVIGKPGLCISYSDLIRLAFEREYWNRNNRHLNGAPDAGDPFDGYVLTIANGAANPNNTNQFTQMEANFSTFFGLSVQAYELLTIPDDTPADRFFDANPNAGHAVGEPGDQAVLFPTLIPDLLDDGELNGTNGGSLILIPDDPSTPEYDGFGPDEVFGFDVFAGGNLTAGLAPGESVDPVSGIDRNPSHTITTQSGALVDISVGSNPFTRSAKCMLCHLGPEQTDHSVNISHGLLKNNAEFEYPTPPTVSDPDNIFLDGLLPAPEPSGSSRTVPGLILAEEVSEGAAQDAVEVEPRNFQTFDDPLTPWDDRVVGQPENFAFGDQGVYNIGLRPNDEDLGRGGDDPFTWPLSLAALTLKNIGGQDYEPCDGPFDLCLMSNFDPSDIGAEASLPGQQGFEETGDGALYPGTTYDLQSINPGFERDPIDPQLPEYMIPWMHSLPAGELHPQIDEMAGMVPNTTTPPNGGPAIEFPEILFGADFHCARYDPAVFGLGPPNFGWGPPAADDPSCPQNQSGVAGNHSYPSQGTWPVPNRVLRNGAFKAPPLRNIELTGPYFHTGSYLTLRQVVDFYFRGGDFPITNAETRDPNVMDLDMQAFAFGRTTGEDLLVVFDCALDANLCGGRTYLAGTFADGLPDSVFLYDEYPDSDHPYTPELAFASREEAMEDAKDALVKFLLALTDQRVRYERAPFDHPELFVPIDGAAPENTGGPAQLVSLSGVPCAVPGPNPGPTCFQKISAVGAGGNIAGPDGIPGTGDDAPTPVSSFLNIASIPSAGDGNDHFDP